MEDMADRLETDVLIIGCGIAGATAALRLADLGFGVTVVTRTDATGSEAVNLEMATERAEAVIDYWTGKGVDRSQVIADPRGEEEATEGADEEQAARERRAEFIITGLLQ